jgi:tRNA (guanine10-N2)-methyltransferase
VLILEIGADENVRANLQQYGLESRYVDMLVADAAQCMWREQELFNAIVTDRELALPSIVVYS